MNRRKRIVVTGGPGGGKSTAVELFRRAGGTRDRGARVGNPALCRRAAGLAIFHVQRNLEHVQVVIGSGFISAQDRLYFTSSGAISGSYDSSRGTLTLAGSDTTADCQAALRSVRFGSASSMPTAGTRVVTVSHQQVDVRAPDVNVSAAR